MATQRSCEEEEGPRQIGPNRFKSSSVRRWWQIWWQIQEEDSARLRLRQTVSVSTRTRRFEYEAMAMGEIATLEMLKYKFSVNVLRLPDLHSSVAASSSPTSSVRLLPVLILRPLLLLPRSSQSATGKRKLSHPHLNPSPNQPLLHPPHPHSHPPTSAICPTLTIQPFPRLRLSKTPALAAQLSPQPRPQPKRRAQIKIQRKSLIRCRLF